HNHEVVPASIGDSQPLSLPVKQLDAEFRLQSLYLMTHGALSDGKLLGGAREAHMPGGGLEGLECIELWQTARHRNCLMRKSKSKRTMGSRATTQDRRWPPGPIMRNSQPRPRNLALRNSRKTNYSWQIGLSSAAARFSQDAPSQALRQSRWG